MLDSPDHDLDGEPRGEPPPSGGASAASPDGDPDPDRDIDSDDDPDVDLDPDGDPDVDLDPDGDPDGDLLDDDPDDDLDDEFSSCCDGTKSGEPKSEYLIAAMPLCCTGTSRERTVSRLSLGLAGTSAGARVCRFEDRLHDTERSRRRRFGDRLRGDRSRRRLGDAVRLREGEDRLRRRGDGDTRRGIRCPGRLYCCRLKFSRLRVSRLISSTCRRLAFSRYSTRFVRRRRSFESPVGERFRSAFTRGGGDLPRR